MIAGAVDGDVLLFVTVANFSKCSRRIVCGLHQGSCVGFTCRP
jgi:hypothetical protein